MWPAGLKESQGTPELSLERPLFDTEVYVNGEKKYVLPDFIVTARAPDGKTARVVIETMGYEDSDYCARKSRAAYRHEADWCSAYRSTEMAG